MDRRELFKTIAGVAAGAGVVGTVKVAEASERTVPALAVFETDQNIRADTVKLISEQWEHQMKGTPFEGMKAIVLSAGMRLTMLDANGHVLNRELGEHDA